METVLTLVARPAAAPVLPGIAAALCRALTPASGPLWLAAGEACDLFVDAADTRAVEAAARGVIAGAAIDVVAQPASGRRKQLLVADLEATIIENEMLVELADMLGLGGRVADITRQAMNGEIDFVGALETRAGLLAGLPEAALDQVASRIRLTPGAGALVATMRRHGARTVLVSGGFTVFAEPVARLLGFDRVVANRLELGGGRILGTVAPPLVTPAGKRAALLDAAVQAGVPPALTLAVGDGANDLPMLAAAGLGVAFHAKPAVAAAARWRLDHADLRALLYLQGYRNEEIGAVTGPPQP